MEKKIFCSALMPLSLMENPEERCENCREYYPAADVDALLQAARALVETSKTARIFLRSFGQNKFADRVDKAIAAVEAIINPPHSSPPQAGNGKA